MEVLLINILFNYLVGAIPFGYIVVKLVSGKDIREHGSKNVGATNATRILGLKYGVLVFLLDMLKGFLMVKLSFYLFGAYMKELPLYIPYIAIIFLFIGHMFPVYLGFKGGKGAATGAGIIIALSYKAALVTLLVWIVIFGLSKIVALATILAAIALPVSVYFLDYSENLFVFVIIAALVVILKHYSNIVRLVQGKENSFKKGKS